jgi:hypothetical protein
MPGVDFLISRQFSEVDFNMEAVSGSSFITEAVFGGVCFIRCILIRVSGACF